MVYHSVSAYPVFGISAFQITFFFQVFCYALSANDNTEWRQRIQSEAEHFLDVSAMSSDAIAKIINEDKIQILINLNGYTKASSEHFRNFKLLTLELYPFLWKCFW